MEKLASAQLSFLILSTALSCTAVFSELVRSSSIWEVADTKSSSSSVALLLGWAHTVPQSFL